MFIIKAYNFHIICFTLQQFHAVIVHLWDLAFPKAVNGPSLLITRLKVSQRYCSVNMALNSLYDVLISLACDADYMIALSPCDNSSSEVTQCMYMYVVPFTAVMAPPGCLFCPIVGGCYPKGCETGGTIVYSSPLSP